MTKIESKLINAYTTLVLAEKKDIIDAPKTIVIFEDGTESTIEAEVEIKVAEKTILIKHH